MIDNLGQNEDYGLNIKIDGLNNNTNEVIKILSIKIAALEATLISNELEEKYKLNLDKIIKDAS
jgi:hypothetical protein